MIRSNIRLRPLVEGDLPVLFAHRCDREAVWMAAFVTHDPNDWSGFQARFCKLLEDESVIMRAILDGDQLVGSIASFLAPWSGQREVGYWIDRACWGRGIASAALRAFLAEVDDRPLYASIAKDNLASRRVLEKCGFRAVRERTAHAPGRGVEIMEQTLELPPV